MKKILIIMLLLVTLLWSQPVHAKDTLAQSGITNKIEQQVNDLKEKIASKVAQLKLVEKRGIIGTVTATTNTQITLSDTHGETRYIDVDEITKFSSPDSKSSFGISDLTKGQKIGVSGMYNKETKRLLARTVNVLDLPIYVHGAIYDIDSKNFNASAIDEKGNKSIIDVENITKINSYSIDNGLEKVSFSKVIIGEHIIAVGFLDKKDKTKLITSRLILFPDIPKDPRITLPSTGSQDTIPSTGSGKKLTPLKPITR